MTPLYMNNCPVPQFPHLSNVSPAVPAHRAVGMVHRCRWDGERGGAHTVLHQARRHPPLHSYLHSRLRGYQVGAHWFSLTPSPCQAQASQPKGERPSQGGARALHQPARGVCPSLGPPWGRAPFSPWRDKALLESSWARWHLVQAWLRQTE